MTRKIWLKRLLPLAALVAIAVAVFALGLDRYLSLDTLRENRQTLSAFVSDNRIGAILMYVAIYILVVALSLPGATVLTLSGGFLFGIALGGTLTVIAATIGATIVFVIARGAIGDSLRRKAGPFMRRMEDGFHENAFSYLLLLRLVPAFPFWVANLVPAFLGVPVGIFMVATGIGIIPGTFVYTTFGAGLGDIFDSGGEVNLGSLLSPTLIAGLIGLALLALLPIAIRKWRGMAS